MFQQSLVIIPTYNEAANIGLMMDKIFGLYSQISVLIIDDNSPDNTGHIVKALQSKHPRLFLIERASKLGLGSAYVTGFEWALTKDFQYILQMDCDFSHDPVDIKYLLLDLLEKRSDLSIGSRYNEGKIRTRDWPWYRLALSLASSRMLRAFTGLQIMDLTGGFKGFRRTTLEKINLKKIVSKGYIFQFETTYKVHDMKLVITEVPIVFHHRLMGKSKMSTKILFEAIYVFFFLRVKKIFGTLN
jgi:dolichol-phosphate mannosyltransferase